MGKVVISVVVGFRNRELERVKKSLDSFKQQSFQDFELIFIDYGSDEDVASKAQLLVSRYSFCNYYYSHTRGWFWNRSRALNTGIKLAKGEVIIISDIDLIVERDFIKKISRLSFKAQFYTFSCYYLPEKISNFNLFASTAINDEVDYVGLCAAKKSDILKINGFDEYFMVWGVEDDDFYERLGNEGLSNIAISVNQFKVFHQWHPSGRPRKPDMWYIAMLEHWFGKDKDSHKTDMNEIIEKSERFLPLDNSNVTNVLAISLDNHQLYRYIPLIKAIFKLKKGEVLSLKLEYKVAEKKGFFKKLKEQPLNEQLNADMEIIHFIIGKYCSSFTDYYFQNYKNYIQLEILK